jgi:hypothetical protein
MKQNNNPTTVDALYFSQFDETQKAMAASMQSLLCCKQIISEANLQSVLDCGSGLSSVLFHSTFNDVVTVDDNAQWAEKTKQFIKEHIGKQIEISTIDSITSQFDFVFYDYGGIEARIFYFKKALGACNGYMYLDDMHISYYRAYVEAKTKGLEMIYLPQTVDEYGRYGAILRKNR